VARDREGRGRRRHGIFSEFSLGILQWPPAVVNFPAIGQRSDFAAGAIGQRRKADHGKFGP